MYRQGREVGRMGVINQKQDHSGSPSRALAVVLAAQSLIEGLFGAACGVAG